MNNGFNVRSLLMTSFAFAAVIGIMTPAYAQSFTTYQVPETCGDIDLAFALDDTGSMQPGIDNIIAGLDAIVTQAENAQLPGSTLRLGLITFKDDVTIVHPLTTDVDAVKASINAITANNGADPPEASDMAKQIAIAASDAGLEILTDQDGNVGTVNGAFNVEWVQGLGTSRVLVILTDDVSGGYDDASSANDRNHFASLGAAAAAKNIAVVDLFLSHGFAGFAMVPFMQADAAASANGGLYADVGADGSNTAQSIIDFLADPELCVEEDPCEVDPTQPQCIVGGEFLKVDSTALLIAGISANLGLIVPIVAGIAGASAYIIKTRMNKE